MALFSIKVFNVITISLKNWFLPPLILNISQKRILWCFIKDIQYNLNWVQFLPFPLQWWREWWKWIWVHRDSLGTNQWIFCHEFGQHFPKSSILPGIRDATHGTSFMSRVEDTSIESFKSLLRNWCGWKQHLYCQKNNWDLHWSVSHIFYYTKISVEEITICYGMIDKSDFLS